MLDFLAKKEYLRVIEPMLAAAWHYCVHCGKRNCCTAGNKTYTITEKGKRLIGQRPGLLITDCRTSGAA